MNIQHLKYAIEVEKAGSISKAADNLYMGQPNLSKAIKELEQALHITIFRRTSKGIDVTPKGREFLNYAKNILAQFEEMESLGSERELHSQELSVSVPRASYVVDAFTDLLLTLDMELPIHIDFFEINSLQAIRNVVDGISDFGMIRCRVEYQEYFYSLLKEYGLERRDILRFSYQLAIQKNSELAAFDVVPIEALRPCIEIIHGDTNLPQMTLDSIETERGETPGNKKIYVYERGSQFDILSRVPLTYMWVSPMPQDLLDRNGLVQRPCNDSPQFKDMLFYLKNHRFSTLEKKLIANIESVARSITGQI